MATGAEDQEKLAAMLAEIGRAYMPFGKFGPAQHPPRGVPLYDLPYEYLAWFERKGFPKGRLGELMEIVYLAKRDGADALFDSFRDSAGGRTSLRRVRRRHWQFDEGSESEAND
jgi:uncharacterized protein (DUF3820 family)